MTAEGFQSFVSDLEAMVREALEGTAHSDLAIETKSGLDILTSMDRLLEERILALVRKYSQAPVFSEEADGEATALPEHWVVDPLDGTINFASGSPLYSVSVAYFQERQPELACVLAPALRAIYTAERSRGSFRQGNRLAVSERPLAEATVSVILTSHFSSEEVEQTLALVRRLSERVRGIRVIVSEALELAWVAEGRLDANISVKCDAFSTAAGWLLVREAGGLVSTLEGAPFSIYARSILTASERLHPELLECCQDL